MPPTPFGRHFTQPAAKPLRDAIRYVADTWPYWARKGGADHLMVFTQDQGTRYVREQVAAPPAH